MIKTLRKLLPLTLLISIFLILSVESRGAAHLNSYMRSCSNMPGSTATNTFWYTIQAANPHQMLNTCIIHSANPVICSTIESPLNDPFVDVTIVTPSPNFEASPGSCIGFSSPAMNAPNTSGSIVSTPVYVRIKPTVADTYPGNISISGDSAALHNVAVSGNSLFSYCTTCTSTTTYMGINHVVFNTINKTTTTLNPGYSDFTASNTTVTAGQTYTLTLTGWQYPQNYMAWFDWNQDGDFTDEGESFTIGQSISGIASVASDILIPANVSIGDVRMRVRSEYLDASVPIPPACGGVEYGECEDYTLIVSAAVPIVWVGSASTDWNTAENWSTNVVPTASDNLTIPNVANGPVVNQDPASFARCNNMTIEAGAVVTIAAGKALTINGTLTNNAGVTGLVIQSTVAGTGSVLHNTADVPATINSYITGNTSLVSGVNTFHLVSIPLSPASISTQNLFSGSYLHDFDVAANTWQGVSTPTPNFVDQTRGYMIYTPKAVHIYQFAGIMNAGPFSPTVTFAGDGNNLVPNPYPSAIDWNSGGWTKTNIANSVYTWPSGGNNYATYVDGQATNGGSNIIPAGQAFIVKATALPTFAMTDAVRVHDSYSFFKSHEAPADLLRIKATSNEMTDEAIIRFTDQATPNADSQYDAWKLYGIDGAPQLYTLTCNNEMMAINSLPYESGAYTVPMNFEQKATADVSFAFSNIESFDPAISIHLQDLKTGSTVNLRGQNTYTFSHTESNDANRFKVIFGGTTGIGESPTEINRIWISDNILYINTPDITGKSALVNFYNMAGQIVMQTNFVLNGLSTINLDALNSGAVVVRLAVNGSIFITKGILIQK